VSFDWKDGKLAGATIRSLLGKPLKIRSGDTVVTVDTQPGETIPFTSNLAKK
jgi:hypothetical protein